MPQKIAEYIERVASQLKWKRVRPLILLYVIIYLQCRFARLLKDGLSWKQAEENAVAGMRNPEELGRLLNKRYQPKSQWPLLMLTGFLMITGFWISAYVIRASGANMSLARLVLYTAIEIMILAAGYYLDYRDLIRCSWILILIIMLVNSALMLTGRISYKMDCPGHYIAMFYPALFAMLLYWYKQSKWLSPLTLIVALGIFLMQLHLMYRDTDILFVLLNCVVMMLLASHLGWFACGRKKSLSMTAAASAAFMGVYVGTHTEVILEIVRSAVKPDADHSLIGAINQKIRSVLQGTLAFGKGTMEGPMLGCSFWEAVPGAGEETLLVTVAHYCGWVMAGILGCVLVGLTVWIGVKACRLKNRFQRFLALFILQGVCIQILSSLIFQTGIAPSMTACPLYQPCMDNVLTAFLMGIVFSIFREETLSEKEIRLFRWLSLDTASGNEGSSCDKVK